MELSSNLPSTTDQISGRPDSLSQVPTASNSPIPASASEPSASETSISSPTAQIPSSVQLLPSGLNPIKTLRILRSIGYGLLLLSLIDLLYILFPPEFTKPIWEYQTVGDLVRLVPVPMLAFMLVFYGEAVGRKKIERPILKVLSWSTLIFGVLCVLLIPLTVVNTLRIGQYNNEQINTQITQQKQQLSNTKVQLEKASDDQLQQLIQLPTGNSNPALNSPKTTIEAKSRVLNNIEVAQKKADEQALAARKNVQQNLMKNSVKIILEALVAGFLFLYSWYVTDWARRRYSDVYESAGGGDEFSANFPKTRKSRRLRR
jgi:hypothetical protein